MLSIDTLMAFSLTCVLLGLSPGPDNIFVMLQSALQGRKAGVIVTLGLGTGLLGHTLAVTFGLAAIFQVSAVAFTVLKTLGVVYLLYLAWQAFKAGRSRLDNQGQQKLSAMALYKRGVLMSSTNPKLAIFFMAFLPQFTDPSAGNLSLQLLLLGLIFTLVGCLVMSLIALLSGSIKHLMVNSPSAESIIHKLSAMVFVGLAVKLVFTQR